MWKTWLMAFSFLWLTNGDKNVDSPLMPSNNKNASVVVQKDFSLKKIKALLEKTRPSLHPAVIDRVLMALQCATKQELERDNLLAVIDYSLPSNIKRLWIFDLNHIQLLFQTYVSHGINSGALLTNNFSNKFDSKASSIGVYNTEKSYRGRHGLSLKLEGLEKEFNNNATQRAIVMHGAWYVEEPFIKKYGRPGRSWGCPAVPSTMANAIINTIKETTLLVAYYPENDWINQSKFLNCKKNYNEVPKNENLINHEVEKEYREDILFVDLNNNKKREENEPIIALTANNYKDFFHITPPLRRMLRRQINHEEYIALSPEELEVLKNEENKINKINFIVPVVKMSRGYYVTEMKIISLGFIENIKFTIIHANNHDYINNGVIYFKNKSTVLLRSSDKFIRWLGL